MANSKSAIKALRQSDKRAVRNLNVKTNIKFLTKQTKQRAAQKDAKSEESLKQTIKALDRAAQKGIMKKNTVARRKSRLIKQIRKATA